MLCVTLLVANFAAVAAAAGQSVNYCGAKMCSHTDAHTFCQYPPGPSPKCVGYIDAQLSSEEKVRLMARLNRRRSEAASGRLQHLPTAGNMLKLRWVEELAREAQRWADQCRPPKTPEERDTCRDLFSVSVGQCVASVVGEAPGLRVESLVDMWYMQSLHFKENVTAYVVPVSNVNFYGDFAQMIWAWSYMVGCGRSRFMAEVNGRLRSVERLVCNFAPRGPSAGRALWAPGAPGASCPPRSAPDPALPALCNFPETVREIQEALERMEHSLGEPALGSGKVRRELRDPSNTEADPSYNTNQDNSDQMQSNKTVDRQPLLSMVLKYFPYLKPYEKEILGKSNAGANSAMLEHLLLIVDVTLILDMSFVYVSA